MLWHVPANILCAQVFVYLQIICEHSVLVRGMDECQPHTGELRLCLRVQFNITVVIIQQPLKGSHFHACHPDTCGCHSKQSAQNTRAGITIQSARLRLGLCVRVGTQPPHTDVSSKTGIVLWQHNVLSISSRKHDGVTRCVIYNGILYSKILS